MKLSNLLKNYDEEGLIILLEGKRKVPEPEQIMLIKLGETLCKKMNHSIFRSGNAIGADYFFCKGVSNVDHERLELILPYSTHRKDFLLTDKLYSLDQIDIVNEHNIIRQTKLNSKNSKLIDLYVNGDRGKFGMKGSYLLRDTVKVTGTNEGISEAAFAIFYDDLENPKSGGTGHTMQMCDVSNIPYVDQTTWMKWI